jgi:hypothetical protein
MGARVFAPFFRSGSVRLVSGLFATAGLIGGCQAAVEDLREWRPSDHTNVGQTGAMQKGQVSGEASANALGLDQVTLSTWQNNCVSCHGRAGAGDGPQAALYKPRDLGDPEFQAQVTDTQLFESIQRGKGKMPGFALPEATAQNLVRLVRLLGRQGQPGAGTAPSPPPSGAPPAGSATVPATARSNASPGQTPAVVPSTPAPRSSSPSKG